MQVIPVIDVKNATVVAAKEGRRDTYAPITTPLAHGSDPVTVAKGLMTVHPFPTMYIADLDAIERRGHNADVIARVSNELPDVTLWVDAGIDTTEALQATARNPMIRPVIGSEVLSTYAAATALLGPASQTCVLSLDFRGDTFLGPQELLQDARAWPNTVIVMTLARVGMAQGPDIGRLHDICRRSDGRTVFVAGGVRDAEDLRSARIAGASGALISTALHTQKIKAANLKEIAGL